MDKNAVAAFVNSPVLRILKLGAGTAALDLCPINLLLDSKKARPQI